MGKLVSLQAKLRVPGGVHGVFCGCFLGTVQNSAVFQHFLLASGISVPNFGSVSLLGRLQSQLNALFLPAISKCWGFPGQEPAETEPAQPGMLRGILGWVRLSQTLSLFLSPVLALPVPVPIPVPVPAVPVPTAVVPIPVPAVPAGRREDTLPLEAARDRGKGMLGASPFLERGNPPRGAWCGRGTCET